MILMFSTTYKNTTGTFFVDKTGSPEKQEKGVLSSEEHVMPIGFVFAYLQFVQSSD